MFWVIGGIILVLFILMTAYGGVYVQSVDWVIADMLKLAGLQNKAKKRLKIVDLGSGNGEIVIQFAKAGFDAYGYEMNPILVLWSKWRIWRAGISKHAHVFWKDIWRENYSDFDLVTIFIVPYLMPRLEKKLQKELRPGAWVIVESFPFPTWKPYKTSQSVFLYKV